MKLFRYVIFSHYSTLSFPVMFRYSQKAKKFRKEINQFYLKSLIRVPKKFEGFFSNFYDFLRISELYFLTVIYFWLENKNHPHKVPKLCLQQKINGDRQGISCADRTVLIFTTHLCIAHFFSPTLGVQSDKELWFFLQAPANSQVISINVHLRKLG